MINEIYELSRSLNRCKQNVPSLHPWIMPLRKSETLILRVGVENGQPVVRDVEYCVPERAVLLWKVQKNKFNTFPGINLYGPIFKADGSVPRVEKLLSDKKKMTPVEIANCLADIVTDCEALPDKKQIVKLYNQLHTFPHKDLLPLVEETNLREEAFRALIQTFDGLKKETVVAFLKNMVEVILDRSKNGELDSASTIVQDLIIGKWDNLRAKFRESSVSVFFDLADYKPLHLENPVKITDSAMKEFVSQRLLNKTEDNEIDIGVCSLTGEKGPLEKKKLPDPPLPIIGNAYLMSMDENAFCHNRYGFGSTTSIFPMGKSVLQKMNDALGPQGICRSDRRGKTWIGVPSGKWDRQGGKQRPKTDLLIAYLEEMPDEEFENARLLGGTERTAETDFESLAGTVCDALKNKIPASENPHLRLLLIRRISKGQAQLVLAERLTVQSLFDAVRRWKDASKNRPPFSLLMPPLVKGDKATVIEPVCPFPSEIIELLQYQWIRDGADSHKLEGPKLGEIYEVFFARERVKIVIPILLEKTIQRISPLILGVGQADHSNWKLEQDRKRFDGNSKKIVLRTFAFLGILLSEIGRKKEDYMKDAPYYIGRMFSLADTLHSQYCEHVRKTELPGQLIGNAHIRIAMENPTRGLARLEERLLIYKAWADRFQGEQAGLAKWCLTEMGKVAEKLAELRLPKNMDDTARVEMFLGYLAHSGKKVITDNNENTKMEV